MPTVGCKTQKRSIKERMGIKH